jgi:hypothetical protein
LSAIRIAFAPTATKDKVFRQLLLLLPEPFGAPLVKVYYKEVIGKPKFPIVGAEANGRIHFISCR